MSYRVYIDESGDHSYKGLDDLSRRYLGLTGVVVLKARYNPYIPNSLESLKIRYFNYDSDNPPILTRKSLIERKSAFGVLRDNKTNAAWEEELLSFLSALPMQVFTIVKDKKEHFDRYADASWNPYDYSLKVLLNRIRGWLKLRKATADIMPESRGTTEDNQLLASYISLRTEDSVYATAAECKAVFPNERLLFKRKDQNIAGLQIADLIAAEQKLLTVQEKGRPLPRNIGEFGEKVNKAIEGKVNQYGRYLLE
ncbi:MAG: DUF3800 domain-containing protein [Chloroflexi bacterium]|nr:DUF3800 domain-containing protein [Chloroflexota bacterium]